MKVKTPHFNRGELDILSLEKSETIPSRWYTGREFHPFDIEAIFSKEWQLAGHISQLQNNNDFILGDAAGNPVIIIKNSEGKLNAFYNVCRHRGGPLAVENGCAKMLQCKYHGWTYTQEGMLRGVPRFNRVDLFDKQDYGLVPLKLEEWEGFLFVNVNLHATPLKSNLGGIAGRTGGVVMPGLKFYKRVVYELKCNWKVYVDNYLEGYHVPYVHPGLTGFLDYGNYKTEVFEKYSLQYSPVKDEANYLERDGDAFYYFIYPNIMLNILPGRLQTNIIQPAGHNLTKVIFDYYYEDITSEGAEKIIKEDIDYSEKVQQEDIEICELVQRGLESRAYDRGRFSVECEEGVYHFQSMLKNSYKIFADG